MQATIIYNANAGSARHIPLEALEAGLRAEGFFPVIKATDSEEELDELFAVLPRYEAVDGLKNVQIKGLMGMASFTDDMDRVRLEFKYLSALFDKYSGVHTKHVKMQTLSMGMSADYKIAIEEGSSLVRIGSLLFGERTPKSL